MQKQENFVLEGHRSTFLGQKHKSAICDRTPPHLHIKPSLYVCRKVQGSQIFKQNWRIEEQTKNDNNNIDYDSDDTVLLEKEITDVIGDGPILRDRLPVENARPDETQEITDQLADLTVKTHPKSSSSVKRDALPVETTNTPVSPNKGKVVIHSYKLRWSIPTNTEPACSQTSEPNDTENEVQHPKVPSGNATQPPLPDKYKIRKFQIDKVRYYTCMYCN